MGMSTGSPDTRLVFVSHWKASDLTVCCCVSGRPVTSLCVAVASLWKASDLTVCVVVVSLEGQ